MRAARLAFRLRRDAHAVHAARPRRAPARGARRAERGRRRVAAFAAEAAVLAALRVALALGAEGDRLGALSAHAVAFALRVIAIDAVLPGERRERVVGGLRINLQVNKLS